MLKAESRGDRRVPIDILLNKYIDGEPHTCRALNLSRSGILLHRLFEPVLEYGEVSLEFELPGSRRLLRVEGVPLADKRQSRTEALRFTSMSAEDRAQLDAFLARQPA